MKIKMISVFEAVRTGFCIRCEIIDGLMKVYAILEYNLLENRNTLVKIF